MTPVRIVSGGSGNTRSVANEAGKERIGMADGKSTYYVSVQAGTVNAGKGDAAFEFEIEATPEEIRELENLFAGAREADRRAYFRAHVPFLEYWHDKPNDDMDRTLEDVYRMIHRLGTPETKRHIEAMGVLDGQLKEKRKTPAGPAT
jgi:hypothetical protein